MSRFRADNPDDGGRVPVLVTGAGSELALAIIKACRLSAIPLEVLACDADERALGLRWADRAFDVADARHDPAAYVNALRSIVAEHRVRLVLPTPDAELDLLPSYRDEFVDDLGCRIVINAAAEMERFHDKWLAYQWYREHDIAAPCTVRADRPNELAAFLTVVGYPVILKPRRGGGSRSLFEIRDRGELDRATPVVHDPIVQPLIGSDEAEFTAGTFRTPDNRVLTIVMRRKLKFGLTWRAEIVEDPALHEFCRRVIRKTQLEGVNNVQFRMTSNGPQVLEINPRFSSTTGMRAHFGFNEVELAVRQYVLGERVTQPVIRGGSAQRFMHEEYAAVPADAPTPVEVPV